MCHNRSRRTEEPPLERAPKERKQNVAITEHKRCPALLSEKYC